MRIEVSSHNDNITGVSTDITEVSTDTSLKGNVLQVTNNASTNLSYINSVTSHNDGLYELKRLINTHTRMKLAYDDIQVSHVNWITPIRPSKLIHTYDNYTVSNHITDPISDPSNYLPPPPANVPKP